MPVRPGQKFVIIDTATGEWVDDIIYDSSSAADDAQARLKRRHPRTQVIDAVYYKPADARMRALGMRAAADTLSTARVVEKVAKKWKNLPKGWTEESVKKFWDSLTGRAPKHPVTRCIKEMDGKVSNPGAFCGGLADQEIPGWREEAAKDKKAAGKLEVKGLKKKPDGSATFMVAYPEATRAQARKTTQAANDYVDREFGGGGSLSSEKGAPEGFLMYSWTPKKDKKACGDGPCQCGGSCGCGGDSEEDSQSLSLAPDYGSSNAALPRGASVVAQYLAASNQVAETILRQMGGARRLSVMTGAKNFISFKGESESPHGRGLGGLSFQFPRGKIVRITFEPSDTYTVEFGTTRGGYKKSFSDVYVGQLQSLFERETGLYLKMGGSDV